MESISHAWRKSLDSLGFPSLLWTILAIPSVGFTLHFLVSGYVSMSGELHIWLIYGLAATGLVFLTLFAFNLACAPFRIERVRRIEAESENSRLSTEHEAALKTIPMRFRQLDGTLWDDERSVARVTGPISPGSNSNEIVFKRLTLIDDLIEGGCYYHNDMKLKYLTSGAEMIADMNGASSKSIGFATFKIVKQLPAYVDLTDA